jgi:hypothetical protein
MSKVAARVDLECPLAPSRSHLHVIEILTYKGQGFSLATTVRRIDLDRITVQSAVDS